MSGAVMIALVVVSVLSVLTSVESYVLVPLYHPISYLSYPPGPFMHSPYIQFSPPQPQPDPELEYSTLDKGSSQLFVFFFHENYFYFNLRSKIQSNKENSEGYV